MQNSEKTAPKVPPNLLMFCMGLKAMKEARYCIKNDTIGIAVVDLSISEKKVKLLAQLYHIVYNRKLKYI